MSLSAYFRTVCLALLYAAIAVAIVYEPLRFFLDEGGHDDWGLTVWLINFQGGLVRRGWPGEVIYQAWQGLGLPPRAMVVVISYALLAVMFATAWRRLRGLYPPEILISGAMFGMPALAHSVLQKDVLGIVLFMAGLAVCRWIRSVPLALALLALVIVAAVLAHETFLFFGVPALITAFGLRQYQAGQRPGPALLTVAPLALAALGSAWFVSTFKGTPAIARAVHDAWLPLWQEVGGAGCCTEPAASFHALGWSLGEGIRQQAIVLDDYSFFVYVPAAWALTLVVVFVLLVATARVDTRAERRGVFAICLLQLACVAPMFVIGLDFGRWIFAWAATSALLIGHIRQSHPDLLAQFPLGGSAASRSWRIHPVWLLILAVPATQWTVYGYLQATPLGTIGFSALRLLEHVLGVDISLG